MNHSDHEFDSDAASYSPAQPTPSTAKTIGTLNIVFGAFLLLCGACYGFQLAAQSTMKPMMGMQQQQFQQAIEAQRQVEIQQLKQQEQVAKTEQEKAALQVRRKALEGQPPVQMPDFTKMIMMDDMRVKGYYLADVTSMLLLNLLMVIAGIGLVGLKEWGRVAALWIAGIKIIRLIAICAYFILVVAPLQAKQMAIFFKDLMQQGAPGGRAMTPEEVAQMTTVYGTLFTVTGLAIMVLGSIYPILVLVLLNRPGVKAACTQPLLPDEY